MNFIYVSALVLLHFKNKYFFFFNFFFQVFVVLFKNVTKAQWINTLRTICFTVLPSNLK
jgi:hypothetical protein